MLGLMYPKELILIKQKSSKQCDICHYWYFGILKVLVLSMNHIFAMVVMI